MSKTTFDQQISLQASSQPSDHFECDIMQSIIQYQRLRRRLRLEYEKNHEKLIALSGSIQNSSDSSFMDIPQVSSKGIEKAFNTGGDVSVIDVEKSESSSASVLCPDFEVSASKPGLSRRDLILARSIEGVNVRDRPETEMDDEKVFVVEAGGQNELNPQKWTRSSRIWAMCVLSI